MRPSPFAWFIPTFVLAACGNQPPPAAPAVQDDDPPPAVERPTNLTGSELRSYDAYLGRFPSPCGGDDTLEACLDTPGSCRLCPHGARFVARSIRMGFPAAQVEARYLARFARDRVHAINTEGAASMGPDDAAVTIVEFADFQCPFCSVSAPLLDSLVENYAPHLRTVYKHFPIKYHPHAQSTAEASVAAQNQGKFWELHHMMFVNRDHLERDDVESYARSLNLDMDRFLRDWDSEETVAIVNADYEEGVALNVRGTPTFYINGREFDFDLFDFGGEDLLAWIELEIEITTGESAGR